MSLPVFNREKIGAILNIVFTGSSIIDMLQLPVDLSRRVIVYSLTGLSFTVVLYFYIFTIWIKPGSSIALYAAGKGYGKLEKPGKVLLENPNLFEALAVSQPEKGSVRESFFVGQLRNAGHHLSLHNRGDFTVDNHVVFEVGGKNKSFKQIAGIPDSFVVADDLETGIGNKIPLWLFGMLY